MSHHPITTPASPSPVSPLFDTKFDSIESLTTSFVSPGVPTLETTTVTEVALGYHRNQQYSITAMTTSTGAVAERYAYTAYGQPTILNASGTVLTSSAVGNRYTYTGREWDETLGLHHFRARWMSPLAGRFLGRDPIGYVGSENVLYEYCDSKPSQCWDPFGLKGDGHHIIPWELFNGLVSSDVQALFDSLEARLADPCYTTHNGKTLNGISHYQYNRTVDVEFDNYLNSINKTKATLTPEEARVFLDRIKGSGPNSVIGKFLRGVKAEIDDAIKIAAASAAAKTPKLKCCPRIVGRVGKKIGGPLCVVAFFCADAQAGGFGHACNEASWPVSQVWVDPWGIVEMIKECPDPSRATAHP
jgi:RHS repeat-associated protein